MTEKEAIKKVKEFGLHHAIGDLPNSGLTVKAFEMAVAALEKQIPQKPYWREEEGAAGYACPFCDMGIVDSNGIRDTYCHSCGQKLDWSENNGE